MSLTISLYSALAAMQATQAAFQITSNNVANANTEGYTRKVVGQQTQIVDGESSGVRLTDIERIVDQNLIRQVREQLTKVADLQVQDTYFTRIQQLFGTLDNNGDLSHAVTELGTSLEALATTPESAAARSEVVNIAMRLANQLQFMSTEVQKMRQETDQEIADTVSRVNDQLKLVNDLNNQIANARALGKPTPDLEDNRDVALNELAQQMDVRYFERTDGRVVVFTTTGRLLVDNTASQITHTPASQVSAELTYPNGIGPITLDATDITGELRGGRIFALSQLRDGSLVDLQAELDRLTETMATAINAAHNDGTAFPPPTTLTGSMTVSAPDAPSMTGTFRATVVDVNGQVVENLDVNLAALAPPNIGQLVAALNGMTNATASINAQGKVVITATGGNRIAVNDMTSVVTTGSQTTGMAQFLGLNDFFASGNSYTRYQSDRQASSTTALGLTGLLTIAHPGGAVGVGYNAGDSLTAIAAAINGAMAGQNITATVLQESSGFRLDLQDTDGDTFYLTDSSTLTSTLNLRTGLPGIANRIAVRSDIINDPNLVAGGEVSGATPLNVGTVAVSSGNGIKAQAMASVFAGDATFTAAGGLAAMTTHFSDYAASIMSVNATKTANITRELEINEAFGQALVTQSASLSQVNIDEEMSNIIILQNAYQASARITTAVSEMMDVLMSTVR